MTIASTPTLLSLDRFAAITGLSPVHFAGATAGTRFPLTTHCNDVWAQHTWQSPAQLVSREEVAYEIAKAEEDIKNILGYSPAPTWEWDEQHAFPGGIPRHPARFVLNYGKLIAPGVRGATQIVAGAVVVYTDADGDGWAELATVTVPTTVTDKREIKLFFAGNEGLPEFEIRPLKNVVINAEAGTATITANSWLFIDPALWEAYPDSEENDVIDISTVANYVTTVDVYRIFNDESAHGVTMLLSKAGSLAAGFCSFCGWGTCANCGNTSQGGTFSIWNRESSFVIPYPATYTDGVWRSAAYADCGMPRLAAFQYYAGQQDRRYLQGTTLDPLSNFWADTIAWMAAARLTRGVCGCDNVRQRFFEIQRDLTQNTQDVGFIRVEKMDIFNSAFGTRVGEVRAWQAVTRLVSDQVVAGGAL